MGDGEGGGWGVLDEVSEAISEGVDCGEGISHAGQVNNAQGWLKSGKMDLSERTSVGKTGSH